MFYYVFNASRLYACSYPSSICHLSVKQSFLIPDTLFHLDVVLFSVVPLLCNDDWFVTCLPLRCISIYRYICYFFFYTLSTKIHATYMHVLIEYTMIYNIYFELNTSMKLWSWTNTKAAKTISFNSIKTSIEITLIWDKFYPCDFKSTSGTLKSLKIKCYVVAPF